MNEICFEPKEKNGITRPESHQRFVLDPFQIYCIVNRSDVIKKNPTKKNSEITAILANSWKYITENEKQRYKYLALKLQHDKNKNVKNKRGIFATKDKILNEEKDSEEAETLLDFGKKSLLPSAVDSEENLMALLEMYNAIVAADE